MFMLGFILTTLTWVGMARIVRAHGLSFSPWSNALIENLRNVRQILREQPDSTRKSTLRWLVAIHYASLLWCVVWFIVFATAKREF